MPRFTLTLKDNENGTDRTFKGDTIIIAVRPDDAEENAPTDAMITGPRVRILSITLTILEQIIESIDGLITRKNLYKFILKRLTVWFPEQFGSTQEQ